jgi:hypothetical protein
MPLNPPSYIGQDVWYSPDVYVNQVPVALYQPPQARGIPSSVLATMQAYTDGESLLFQDPTQASNQIAALNQKLVANGTITQSDLDATAASTPSEITPASGKQNSSISNDTGGVENLSEFPPSLRLSDNFDLGSVTRTPGILLKDSQWWVTRQMWKNGNGPLKPGEIVANLKLLCVNILEPLRAQFPGVRLTNTVRNWEQGGQHTYGQAADLQIPNYPNKHYDMAVWIQNNLAFDQLLFERETIPGNTWVHVSYVGPGSRSQANHPFQKGNPYKVAGFCVAQAKTRNGGWYLNGIPKW